MHGTTEAVHLLNLGALPRCPRAPAGHDATLFTGDGGHRWGPRHQIQRCVERYICADCGTVMEVDSSD